MLCSIRSRSGGRRQRHLIAQPLERRQRSVFLTYLLSLVDVVISPIVVKPSLVQEMEDDDQYFVAYSHRSLFIPNADSGGSRNPD